MAGSPADIVPNAVQPRTEFDREALDELVNSIREVGVLQPIVVRPIAGQSDKYELIMGERRLRATKELGLDTIPAVIKDTADEDMLRDALLENLHRSNLNPLEEASAYQQLLADFGITQEELAGRIGRSRPQITNTLRLLKLPAAVQTRVAAGVLSAGHARAILSTGDVDAMQRLADKIVNEDLSVRAAEAAASATPKPVRPKASRVVARVTSTRSRNASVTGSTHGSRSPSAHEKARSWSISRRFRISTASWANSGSPATTERRGLSASSRSFRCSGERSMSGPARRAEVRPARLDADAVADRGDGEPGVDLAEAHARGLDRLWGDRRLSEPGKDVRLEEPRVAVGIDDEIDP